MVRTSTAVVTPVLTFSAPPLHPVVPHPLVTLKPVMPLPWSVQVTRMVYSSSAVAVTSEGAAGGLASAGLAGCAVAEGEGLAEAADLVTVIKVRSNQADLDPVRHR